MKLELWDGLLWQFVDGVPIAYCPNHRLRLEIVNSYGDVEQQSSPRGIGHDHLQCPNDGQSFPMPTNWYYDYTSRYISAREALALKDVRIVDLDGFQVPILKEEPEQKDQEYWAQVRINSTKRGKQLVIYAGERGARDKAQIFLDLENDKITFDQNNMHPNDVFVKIVGEFKSGRTVSLKDSEDA